MRKLADYIVGKLRLAGVTTRLRSDRGRQDESALELLVDVATGTTLTLWLIQHRSGPLNGLLEVLPYSEPFDAECLIEIGPTIVGKILRECRAYRG